MAECIYLKYLCFPMSGRQCLKLESRARIGSSVALAQAERSSSNCEQRSEEKSPRFVLWG